MMIRNLLSKGVLDHMEKTIMGGDMFVKEIKNVFSYHATMFGHDISMAQSFLYMGILFLLSIIAIILIYAKTYRRK